MYQFKTSLLRAINKIAMLAGLLLAPYSLWAYEMPDEGMSAINLLNDGVKRSSLLYTPDLSKTVSQRPLIIILHGGGGNSEKARSNTDFAFEKLADGNKFILAYPEATRNPDDPTGGHWNDGRGHYKYLKGINDVEFLENLVTKLTKKYSIIDPSKVFIAGASNGGMMVQRLLCSNSSKFRSYASIVAGLPKRLSDHCTPCTRKPFLFMAGTEDTLMQYNSEYVHNLRDQPALGERLTIPDTVKHWLNALKCNNSQYSSEKMPDINTDDSSTVILKKYDCNNSVEFHFYKVKGGGHHWPGLGKPGFLKERLLGPLNKDINSAKEVFDFFMKN